MADLADILEGIRIALDKLPDVIADAIGGPRPSPQPAGLKGLGSPDRVSMGFHGVVADFSRVLGGATPALAKFVAGLNEAARQSGVVGHIAAGVNRLTKPFTHSPFRRTGAKIGDFLRKNGMWAGIAGATFGGMSGGVFAASMLRKHGIKGLRGAGLAAHKFFGSGAARSILGDQEAKSLRGYAAQFYKHVSSGGFGAHFSKFTTTNTNTAIGKLTGLLSPLASGGPGWIKAGMAIARGISMAAPWVAAGVGAAMLAKSAVVGARDFAEEQLRADRSSAALSPKFQGAMAMLALGDMKRSFEMANRTGDSSTELAHAVNRLRNNQVDFNANMTNFSNIMASGSSGFAGGVYRGLGRATNALSRFGGGLAESMGFNPQTALEDLMDKIGNLLTELFVGPLTNLVDMISDLLGYAKKDDEKDQNNQPWILNQHLSDLAARRVVIGRRP